MKASVKENGNAFSVPDFRIYLAFQFVSSIWTQGHAFAQSVHVHQMTGSSGWTGFVASVMTLPSIVMSLSGGTLTDRFGIRRIMTWNQICCIIPALLLGILTLAGRVVLSEIITVAVLFGIVNSVDAVARQTLLAQIVGRTKLQSATAAFSGVVQTSLFVGPWVAGALMLKANIGWVYLLNGLSFGSVLLSLSIIRIRPATADRNHGMAQMMKDGLRYAFNHVGTRSIVVLGGLSMFFGFGFRGIFPVIAAKTFHASGKEITHVATILASCTGLGAITGTLIAGFSRIANNRGLIIFGFSLCGTGLLSFSLMRGSSIAFSAIALFAVTCGFSVVSIIARSTIQFITPSDMRARVMGVLVATTFGSMGFGTLFTGFAAEAYGPLIPIGAGGIVIASVAMVLIFIPSIRRSIPRCE